MNKEVKKAATQFRADMQELSDKDGLTVSMSVNGGEEHIISAPKEKVEQATSA